jgi:site-specific DNA recombinase
MRIQQSYEVGIYCRLSRDDNNGTSESMSIANQRQMLVSYAEEKGWNVRDIYVDDGYSGTTFDRPDFERMIEDIERGKINMVLTKDLSRLGRNYVMTGQYTDFFFPQYNVRYIALGDNYDSLNSDNDIAPFKNILNEMYAKDISKKIKGARAVSARQGKFMGSIVPYGYMRSPADRHKLIVDEATATNVQRIFQSFAMGDSARHIGSLLNEENILSPRAQYYRSIGRTNPNPNESMTWNSATVMQLLKNPVYIGQMVQGKRMVTSFKTKKREFRPKDSWIVVENTHEPLIDNDLWETAQARIRKNRHKPIRVSSEAEVSLFSGILKCADCGAAMAFNRKVYKGTVSHIYRCSRYAMHGKSVCSTHSISMDTLVSAVLTDIQQNARLAAGERQALTDRLLKHCGRERERELSSKAARLNEARKRVADIDTMTQELFEEKHRGNVPDNIFKRMLAAYDTEQTSINSSIAQLQSEIDAKRNESHGIAKWVSRIRELTNLKTLDRSTVVTLIDRITVSEKHLVDGIWEQDIGITYKFVGCLNSQEQICS